MQQPLAPYLDLLTSFTQSKLSATEFESRFFELFKHDETDWPEPVFLVLDRLFGAVDAFCVDPKLREERDLDEEQLRSVCQETLTSLLAYTKP